MKIIEIFENNLHDSIIAKQAATDSLELKSSFKNAAQILIECYQSCNKLLIAGNGGSAADAQHMAAEFVSKLARDRGPLPAEALTVDTSILTAIGNDYGYAEIFSRQIACKANLGDVFMAITTSGNSQNILSALKTCREKGVKSILLSNLDGGQAASLADCLILVPGNKTSTIQELHLVIEHTLCEIVENTIFFGEKYD